MPTSSFIDAKQLTFRVDRVRRGWAATILGCENLTFRKLSQFDPITRKTLANIWKRLRQALKSK